MTIKSEAALILVLTLLFPVFSFSPIAADVLRIEGSSTVDPIVSRAAAFWKENPPSGSEYWPVERYDIATEKNLVDYWRELYSVGDFNVQVVLSHSGVGLKKVAQGRVDIANSSTAVRFEYPDRSEEELSGYTPHVVGYDRQAISVSKKVYQAGCTVLSKAEIIGILTGEISNWSGVDSCSYDREIQVIGRAHGSGTETMFRVNVFGGAKVRNLDGVDVRYGQNAMVKQALGSSNNAIGYPGVGFVGEQNPPVKVIWDDGKTYSIEDQSWPLQRPLYMYTWKGTSKREAAFLRMILSDFGQDLIVGKGTDYYKLTEEDQAKELTGLPDVQ